MQNDFGTAELEIAEMAESRFQTLNEEKIAELLNDKDSKNTQKGTKGSRLIFDAHLQERNLIRKPATAKEVATVLREFYAYVSTFCLF